MWNKKLIWKYGDDDDHKTQQASVWCKYICNLLPSVYLNVLN